MPLNLLIGRYSEVKNTFKRDINFNGFRNPKGTLSELEKIMIASTICYDAARTMRISIFHGAVLLFATSSLCQKKKKGEMHQKSKGTINLFCAMAKDKKEEVIVLVTNLY